MGHKTCADQNCHAEMTALRAPPPLPPGRCAQVAPPPRAPTHAHTFPPHIHMRSASISGRKRPHSVPWRGERTCGISRKRPQNDTCGIGAWTTTNDARRFEPASPHTWRLMSSWHLAWCSRECRRDCRTVLKHKEEEDLQAKHSPCQCLGPQVQQYWASGTARS